MNTVSTMLAASSTLAQIVRENKGHVLSTQDTAEELPLMWLFMCGVILFISAAFVLFIHRRRQRRHYRAR